MNNKIKYLFLVLVCFSGLAANAQQIEEADTMPVYLTEGSAMAVSTVSGEKLLNMSGINPANALYGRLNGLVVLQGSGYGNTGEPDPIMYIRGVGTTNANNSPLILIDGMERPLNSLVVEEIESVTVLKDAAALALYGMRGANGVLLVTTRRGKEGKVDINLSYQHTFTAPVRLPGFADASAYAQAVNEGLANERLSPRYSQYELAAYKNRNYPYLFPDVDWIDETLRNGGNRDQVNISANGGTDKIRFFSLINFMSDRGLIKESGMNSYSTQISSSALNVMTNLDVRLTPSTLMQANIHAQLSEKNRPGTLTSLVSSYNTFPLAEEALMYNLYTLPSNSYPVRNENGTWGGGSSLYPVNPVAQTSSTGYATAHARGIYSDLLLKQKLDMLVEGLSIEGRVGFDAYAESRDVRTKQFLSESVIAAFTDTGAITEPVVTQYGSDELDLDFTSAVGDQRRYGNLQFRLNYNLDTEKSSLAAFLMYKQDKNTGPGQFNTYTHQDVLAFGHYALLDRYYFDISVAASGSSRLPAGARWGLFPAVAAAWRIGQEKFLRSADWLDELKLRVSLGLTGNDRVAYGLDKYPYIYRGSYIFRDEFSGYSGMAEGHLPSKNVTYEKTRMFNAGIETRLFRRVMLNADVFCNNTYDIMVSTSGTGSSMLGATHPLGPEGKVRNYGLEIGLNVGHGNRDFSYNIGGQISFARNEIIEMNEQYRPYDYLKSTGLPVGQMFGLETIGFFKDEADIAQSPTQMFSTVYAGDLKYKDQNSDGKIDQYDMVPVGYNNIYPEMYYSVSLDLEYKGIGLSALLQGAAGYSAYLNTPGLYFPLMGNRSVSTHYLDNRWKPGADNGEAKFPRLTTTESNNNYRQNTTFITDISYLKLRYAEVYYRLPESVISRIRVSDFKIFLRGMNLFSLDNIKVTDPEVRGAVYPALRSYHIGMSVTF